jgi:hypothetical protein
MADSVRARWIGLDAVRQKLVGARQAFLRYLDDDMRSIAEFALQAIRERTPEDNPREGRPIEWTHTRDLWEIRKLGPAHYVIDHPYNYVATFDGRDVNGPNFSLLLSLEYGTRPHVIDAVNAPRLRFFWEAPPDAGGPGAWRSTEAVFHPGTDPANGGLGIVRPTLEEVRPRVRDAVLAAWPRFFEERR